MKFDINKWSEYKLGNKKYFDIERGESKYLKNMSNGDYPYISSTNDNNGIAAYVSEFNRNGNLITLAYDGSIGSCFYQENPFFASEKIVTINLVQKELNRKLAMFLIQVIKLESEMYSYGGRKWTVNKQLMNTTIKLPSTPNGEPDYEEMERIIDSYDDSISSIPDYFLNEGFNRACWYMDNIDVDLFETKYSNSQTTKKIRLSDREWDYYLISRIVDPPYNGKSYNSADLNSVDYSEDYVNYVTRTEKNNGISKYVEDLDYDGLEEENAIVIGDTTSTITYQSHKFVTGPHMIIIRANWLNPYTAMFFITMLNYEKYRYPVFGRAFTKDLISNTKIYLPKNGITGNPDFEFMENYIKSKSFSCNIL